MRRPSRQMLTRAALGVSLFTAAGATIAPAANITWTAGGGAGNTNFSSTLNWATATVPGVNDNAFIQLAGSTTVTLDTNPHTFIGWLGSPTGGTLTLLDGGGAARTWTLDGAFNTVEGGNVALNGPDVITPQFNLSNNTVARLNAGVNVTSGRLTLGTDGQVGTAGQLDVNFGAALNVSGFADVGVNSFTGTLNVIGGAATLTSVQVAAGTPFNGTLTLGNLNVLNGGSVTQSGGGLTLASNDGAGQRGTLTVNGGGSVYTYASHAPITIGGTTTSLGTLSVAGGTFAVTANDATITVQNNGTISLSGGTLATASDLNLVGGRFTRSNGTISMAAGHAYNVSGGGSFSWSGLFGLGNGNTMNVTAGAVGVTNGGFDVGNILGTTLAANNSTLALSGGSSTLASSGICTWGGGTSGFANVTIASGAQASLNSLLVGTGGGGASVTLNGGTLNISGTSGLIIGAANGATTPAAVVAAVSPTSAVNVNISTTTINPRGTLRLTNGGRFNSSGSIINVNGGTFDAADGAFAFTASSWFLTVANNGLFNGATLSTTGQTPNVQVNTAGRMNLTGTLNYSGGVVNVDGAGSSFAANTATFTNARVTIGNNSVGSFGIASVQLDPPGASTFTVNNGAAARFDRLGVGSGGTVLCSGGTVHVETALGNGGSISTNSGTFEVVGSTLNTGRITMDLFSTGSFGDVTGVGTFAVIDANRVTANFFRQSLLDIEGLSKVVSRPNGTATGVSRVNNLTFESLTLPGVEQWDITDNGLVVDYPIGVPSPFSTIRADIVSGYNNGSWTGNGIASSTAAADHRRAIGYAEASQLGAGSFMGQTVDDTSVLARTTFAGDSNLDGTVNLTDFTFLAANFNGANKNWVQGDYNYDGMVNLTDFTLLASNFNQSLPLAAGGGSPGQLGATVPEPITLPILPISAALFVRKRRRNSAARR